MNIKRMLKKPLLVLLVLCLIMQVLPAPEGEAAYKVKLNKTRITLVTGNYTVIKLTKGGRRLKTKWTSSNKKIASVGKNTGIIKAKKKGTCKISAKYARKKYTCMVTVKSKPNPVIPPSYDNDNDYDYDYPSYTKRPNYTQRPSYTQKPSYTLKPLFIQKPVYTPDNSYDDDNYISDNSYDDTDNNPSNSYDNPDNSYDGIYDNTNGISIVITGKSKIAYTNENCTEAYIYYDVIDQYGNSVRSSANINWTITGADNTDINKSSGKITIRKSNDSLDKFTYGAKIYISGVDINSGASINETVQIGGTSYRYN